MPIHRTRDVFVWPSNGLDAHAADVKKANDSIKRNVWPTSSRGVEGNVSDARVCELARWSIKVGTASDVRRAKEQANAHVHKLVFYDSQTGLPNTKMFCQYAGGQVLRAQGNHAAIFLLKIDRLLRVNDCRGHKIGEALVCQIAQRLQECVPDDGMVARSGRDEFVLFLGHASGDELARDGADNIRQALSRPFTEGACEYQFTASIGISMSPRDGSDIPALLISAETAMLRAQGMGGDTCQFYVPEIATAEEDQLMLESSLRKAVPRQELFIEYQPSLNSETGVLTGLQAQVRWKHPVLDLLQPDSFIPLANESKLIAEIGFWVMQSACHQVQAWHQAGHTELTIAVKVSTVQFLQPDLVQTIARVINDTGIAPHCLELKLTEATLMRHTNMTALTLQALKNLRVKISVSGFHTGRSFLSYLGRFPIDILRINKLLSCALSRDVKGAAIMQAIGALAHGLGLAMLAEGVETVDQFNFFLQQGCDRVQGFLFRPPLSVTDITEMLGAPLTYWDLPQAGVNAAEQRLNNCVGQIPTRGFAGVAV